MKICVVCEKPLTGRQRKYCGRKCLHKDRNGMFGVSLEEKQCCICKKVLPAESFHKRTQNTTGLASMCKSCSVEYKREERKEFKLLCLEHSDTKCAVCGYDEHWAVLQFHHRNPEEKCFEIGRYKESKTKGGIIPPDLQAELDKCMVVCANCHSIIHCGE
jgi:hypothetical protein